MTERGDKHEIIPTAAFDLVRYGSSLVRRGLHDLSKPIRKKGRVLLVSDNRNLLRETEQSLLADGYEVRLTCSSGDAVEIAKVFFDPQNFAPPYGLPFKVLAGCAAAAFLPQFVMLGLGMPATLRDELPALGLRISKLVLWGTPQNSDTLKGWCYDFELEYELIPVSFGAEEMLRVMESWVAGAWTENGYALDAEEDHTEALACHDRAIAIDPMCSAAWINRGWSLDELGRRSDAIASYERAVEINPSDWTPWVRKGDILDRVGQSEQAILCFDSALAITPDIVSGWEGRGMALHHLGRYEEALRCYDKMLEIDRPSWTDAGRANVYSDAWYYKGTSLSKMGRHQESIECYDKAIECNPHNSTAWWAKGNSLRELKKFDEAIACYDKALAIWPEHAQGWHNKGICLACLGRYQESTECYEKAIAIDPTFSASWYNKGRSLWELKKFDEAIGCYDRALELQPEHPRRLNIKGASLWSMGRLEEALVCFERALNCNPPEVSGWYAKACVQEALGRTQDAIDSYEKYLAVAPPETAAEFQHAHALERLRELKSKTQKPEPGAPRYVYVVRDKGAAIEAGDIGYPDIETAILEALRQKWELHAAGKLSDQAYRDAFREYQSMVKNHFQNRGEEPNE